MESVKSCIVNKSWRKTIVSVKDINIGRAWRIENEGALYHILSRGNEQKDKFYDDQDWLLFLKTIGEMSERFEISVFAYVLMGNHYHLLLKTNRANLSKSIQWTRRFNLWHFRSGHLFQGKQGVERKIRPN